MWAGTHKASRSGRLGYSQLLIVSRRPGNVIGWIFLRVPLFMAASQVAGGYASRSLPGSVWVALLPDLLWIAAVPLGAMLVMLLFPTGHLPSRRWRPVVWATVAATAAVVVGMALTPGPAEYFPDLQNPLGIAGAGPALDLVVQVGFLVMVWECSRPPGR